MYEEVLRIVDSDVSARKLFVRNLPFDADEASLRPLVAPYGDIVEASGNFLSPRTLPTPIHVRVRRAQLMVARDKATGKGRGYAFCTFAHAEDADRVLQTKTRSLGVRATGAPDRAQSPLTPERSRRAATFIFRSPLSETANRTKAGGHPRALEAVEGAGLPRPLRPCCTTP